MRRTTAVAVLMAVLVTASMALSPTPAEAAVNPYAQKLGVAMGPNEDAYTLGSFGGVKDMGATWIRLQLSWKDIEEVQGVRTWGQTDKQINNARAKGLKVLAVITYTPDWADHPKCNTHPCAPAPDRYDDFGRFAARAATRYNGRVSAWEIWNEPNERNFWKPKVDPAGYAQLLRQATYRIKAAVPTAKVLLGGLSTHYQEGDPRWMTWRTFLTGFYAAGGAPYDALAIHPYYPSGVPMRPVPDNPFYNLPKVKQFLTAHGAGSKKIWITEFGYKTKVGALTPRQQGERLKQALTQVVQWTFVERMFIFSWMDFRNEQRDILGAGLNYVDGTPKESRWMIRALVRAHAV